MDQLSSKNEKVLYDLFELAGDENSRLVLIGIANGLDMLERVLPNLSKNNKPKQLNFQPYKTAQIETLIKVSPSVVFESVKFKLIQRNDSTLHY